MRILPCTSVAFRSPSGAVVAHVTLMPVKDAESVATAPLAEMGEEDAREYGETTVQLRESERYEYEVVPINGADLRLRCSLSSRRRSLGNDGKKLDAGLIETRSFCGTLLLELVEGEVNGAKSAVASALLDVRSLKLDYRTEYRGMLRRISDEIAALVADARSSAKTGFRSTFEDRTDAGWLQIQLELLREILDSTDFSAALQRILSFPHERLSTVSDPVSTDRPISWTLSAVRQLLTGNQRRTVPATHPLRTQLGLQSVAERVLVPQKLRNRDTLENRFVKFALGEFQAFLTHAQGVFESCSGWGASAVLSGRLAATVEDWLGRSLFREVGEMYFAPLGSPVLQRKAGYREVLRWWLRFRTAAELSWEGGEELFHAGQRDVASLYEYWLFFELLGWFCKKCRGGERPAVEELIEGLDEGSPNLRLRKQYQLGPFDGMFVGKSRKLKARFTYNRRFEVTQDRHDGGSWTQRLHPDYTLTFWPADLSEVESERHELLVHVHFDAKYRVKDVDRLFGGNDESLSDEDQAVQYEKEEKEEGEGNYQRGDLLKMHAYRDAIKRSQGAYILYPGWGNYKPPFRGFHEILPGLGAFGVAPDANGKAQGLESLEKFLDEVLAHLGNCTTAQERVSYHIAESYTLKEEPLQYGSLVLAERDEVSDIMRALPPSEHHIVVAWYENNEQLQWIKRKGFVIVRLGDRRETWNIPPEFASARHVLLHTYNDKVVDGLLKLKRKKPGYKIFTAHDLKVKGYPCAAVENIYAVFPKRFPGSPDGDIYAIFEVEPDPVFIAQRWDGSKLKSGIKAFESRRKYREFSRLGRSSAIPMVLSLQDLLKAMM
jgi:predicted component of viral defense system (DUF524 family)